jgi:hypothetical protein
MENKDICEFGNLKSEIRNVNFMLSYLPPRNIS